MENIDEKIISFKEGDIKLGLLKVLNKEYYDKAIEAMQIQNFLKEGGRTPSRYYS